MTITLGTVITICVTAVVVTAINAWAETHKDK